MTPSSRPKLSKEELRAKIALSGYTLGQIDNIELLIVGIRGYYLNTMGEAGKNDRGIYDDAIFLVTPQVFKSFNANTDPSAYRDNIAVLRPGLYPSYRFDIHRGKKHYPAICQRVGNVTVDRDNGKSGHSGMFGINIHNGGWGTTGSLGCQTIHPSQWDDFYQSAKSEAVRMWGDLWDKNTVTYLLLENK